MRTGLLIASLLYLGAMTVSSCGTSAEGGVASNVTQSNEGLASLFNPHGLLGAAIGDSRATIDENMGTPHSTEGDENIYKGTKEGIDHTLYLNFDENVLYEITLDLFPSDSLATQETFEELQRIMDDRFQKSRPAPGFATWKTASPSGKLVEVTLADESYEYGAPLLMLNLIENYDRTFKSE